MARTKQDHDGPEVNGQLTKVTICSTDQLQQSIYLPSLLSTINVAFYKAHASRPELGMDTGDRLGSTEHLLATLTHDPESFIIIISHTTDVEVLATASCRRYLGPTEDLENPWLRRSPVEEGCIEWELKMMATHPTVQGKGLAGYMMKLAEEEIIERTKMKLLNSSDQASKNIKLVLSTPTEINGAYYARKGYREDYEVDRGGKYNFHIVFMSKIIGRIPGKLEESALDDR